MTTLPKDPIILLSYINTKLRDFYPSLSELCNSLFLEEEEIKKTLASINYQYDASQNQFV